MKLLLLLAALCLSAVCGGPYYGGHYGGNYGNFQNDSNLKKKKNLKVI